MNAGDSLFLRSPARAGSLTSWSERLLAFVEAGHARACLALLLLSLVCFCPGIVSLQPMDRDEPRFAQASKQMIETGDYISIRFHDEARNKKPVGIHWLQSGVVRAAEALGLAQARTQIWLYRLPSLFGALAAVLFTYWAALAFAGRREAFLAAAFMAACVTLMVEARLAKTDAVLTACSVAAMGALARAYLGRGATRLPLSTAGIFWLSIAAGILIKGPLILMFAGLCATMLSIRARSGRWLIALRPGWGALAVLLLVSPWFVAIAWKTGGVFFTQAVGGDMLGKVAGAQQKHGAPPGFYFVAFSVAFWPAAALSAVAAPFAWKHRRDDRIAFALAWIVPSWLIFEAVPTKLPHYVLPLYPAVAILTVLAMTRGHVGPRRWGARATALLIPSIPLAVTVLLCVGAWRLDHVILSAALPVMLAASAVAIAAWLFFCRGEVTRSAVTAVAAAAILSAGVFGLAQPFLASLKLSPRLAEAAARVGCAEPIVATLGYREPSLVFLVGTQLRMVESGAAAAAFAAEGGCRVILVDSRFEPDFLSASAARGLQPTLSTRVAGFNINGGRFADIAAYAVMPPRS